MQCTACNCSVLSIDDLRQLQRHDANAHNRLRGRCVRIRRFRHRELSHRAPDADIMDIAQAKPGITLEHLFVSIAALGCNFPRMERIQYPFWLLGTGRSNRSPNDLR